MTFASAISGRTVIGNKRKHWGTYTNTAGGTGGDIDTGLVMCENINFTVKSSSAVTSVPGLNETLPIAGSAVTIVTASNEVGYWEAIGY